MLKFFLNIKLNIKIKYKIKLKNKKIESNSLFHILNKIKT
jgi:hypothetical protein